jgi:D-beta-D-heptose 7-phosphate kinase/D-beta-D-heptose 1-phosphate adenosyltransferase
MLNPVRARELLDAAPRQHILVVGDLMLDRYVYGRVGRISPEAPVPIVEVTHDREAAGGASNVAANVRALGGEAAVAGVIGRDPMGEQLLALLSSGGVNVDAVIARDAGPTTVKTRVIAEQQQVVRVDREQVHDWTAPDAAAFEQVLRQAMRRSTGVVLEDYGKGALTQAVVDVLLSEARARGIPIGYDPKEGRHLDVAGVTIATPNRHEALLNAGIGDPPWPQRAPMDDQDLRNAGRILFEKWQPVLLLITLGAQGMLLLQKDKPGLHVPTRAREVYDVSGAGDTVIGTTVLALAAGATAEEAAELANYAAGVVVGKLGTATCSREELLAAVGGS